MQLNQLPKLTARSKKRVGRGIGSGVGGHTTGKGNKGQKARSGVPITMEGTKFKKSLIKRIPFQRGKFKFKTLSVKNAVLNLSDLTDFTDGSEITIEALVKKGLIPAEVQVKLLGEGEVKTKLIVKIPASASATKKIEKAGGSVEVK
jgi:large subunit ribosomal protein L15